MSRGNKHKDRDTEYALVYSTDPAPKPSPVTAAIPQAISWPLRPKVQLEKKGRGGKSVTVVSNLPAQEPLLKDLCSQLKKTLGCGGTFYIKDANGIVEIQGERQEEVRSIIAQYKGPKR